LGWKYCLHGALDLDFVLIIGYNRRRKGEEWLFAEAKLVKPNQPEAIGYGIKVRRRGSVSNQVLPHNVMIMNANITPSLSTRADANYAAAPSGSFSSANYSGNHTESHQVTPGRDSRVRSQPNWVNEM
jgi:hypothetical protein